MPRHCRRRRVRRYRPQPSLRPLTAPAAWRRWMHNPIASPVGISMPYRIRQAVPADVSALATFLAPCGLVGREIDCGILAATIRNKRMPLLGRRIRICHCRDHVGSGGNGSGRNTLVHRKHLYRSGPSEGRVDAAATGRGTPRGPTVQGSGTDYTLFSTRTYGW